MLIGDKLSDGYSRNIYIRSRMNLTEDTAQTQIPLFVHLGILNINVLDEGSGLSTLTIRIRSPTSGAHWSVPNHIFGETLAVGVRKAKSEYDYN